MIDDDAKKGLYRKYRVTRVSDSAGKHDACEFFVLDWEHDKFAIPAALAYARACEAEFPELAADLHRQIKYYAGRTLRPTKETPHE